MVRISYEIEIMNFDQNHYRTSDSGISTCVFDGMKKYFLHPKVNLKAFVQHLLILKKWVVYANGKLHIKNSTTAYC